jgi:hypothetical protein
MAFPRVVGGIEPHRDACGAVVLERESQAKWARGRALALRKRRCRIGDIDAVDPFG